MDAEAVSEKTTETVLETRESKSRPTQGLVTVKTIGRNQHGTIVMEF